MTEKVHFKLAYNGATYKFASVLHAENRFAAVTMHVAKLVKERPFELFWKDDDSNVVLETVEDLSTAVEYAMCTRKRPTDTPCVLLEVVAAKTLAADDADIKEAPLEETTVAAQLQEAVVAESINTEVVEPTTESAALAIPAIQEQLQQLYQSALEEQWTAELRSALDQISSSESKDEDTTPIEPRAAEVAILLAELEKRVPDELKLQLLQLSHSERVKVLESDWLEREGDVQESSDAESVAMKAVRLAVELAITDKWLEFADCKKKAKRLTLSEAKEELKHLCREMKEQGKAMEKWDCSSDSSGTSSDDSSSDDSSDDDVSCLDSDFEKECARIRNELEGKIDWPADISEDSSLESDEDDDDDVDCWTTKSAEAILQLANKNFANAHNIHSPAAFLRHVKASAATDGSPTMVELIKARLTEYFDWIDRNPSQEQIKWDAEEIWYLYVDECEEQGVKAASKRSRIAGLLRQMADAALQQPHQLQGMQPEQLSKVLLQNWMERKTEVKEDKQNSAATLNALLYACGAALMYPSELREVVKNTIEKHDDEMDYDEEGDEFEKEMKAIGASMARWDLPDALASYMTYQKLFVFEKHMIPAVEPLELLEESDPAEWAEFIESLDMSEEMLQLQQPQQLKAVKAEISKMLHQSVYGMTAEGLGKMEESGLMRIAEDVFGGWWCRMDGKIRKAIREQKKSDAADKQQKPHTDVSPAVLAALLAIAAAAEQPLTYLKKDLAGINVRKSVCEEVVKDDSSKFAPTKMDAEQLAAWVEAQTAAILQKGLEQIAPVLALLVPRTQPVQQLQQDLDAREMQLKIREKALELKEEVFERQVAIYQLKMDEFDEKFADLDKKVASLSRKRSGTHLESRVDEMCKRLKRIEDKVDSVTKAADQSKFECGLCGNRWADEKMLDSHKKSYYRDSDDELFCDN